MIDGGEKRNVLPARAWAVVNFRTLPGESVADVTAHVKRTIADRRIQIEPYGVDSEPSMVSDIQSEEFQALHRTIRDIFGDVLVAPSVSTVTTDARHYERIAENTFHFIPTRMQREDLERVHGTNERVSVENYLEIIQFFIRLIENTASSSESAEHA